ncbi:membrane-associated PAP2 superfamily phosphatase [Bradyrhizobium sp. USDA 327]
MNRTGLFIALALWLVIGVVFGLYPELDLKLAALFFDPATKTFPLKLNGWAGFARDAAMWIAWAFALPSIVTLVVKMVRPDRPLMVPGRTVIFLLVTLTMSAGILTNLTFKTYWGRPRPVVVTEFAGDQQFVPWWDPRGGCGRNCSFFSGEGATAFWTLAAGRAGPARVAAARLCRRRGVRRLDQRAAHGLRRPLLHRRFHRRPRHLRRDLVRLRADLPLAADAVFG